MKEKYIEMSMAKIEIIGILPGIVEGVPGGILRGVLHAIPPGITGEITGEITVETIIDPGEYPDRNQGQVTMKWTRPELTVGDPHPVMLMIFR